MTAQPPPPVPANDPGRAAGDAQCYRIIIDDLIDMGVELARQIHQRAKSRPACLADIAEPFERATRAVCRSIILDQYVAEPLLPPAGAQRAAARKRVIREIEDAIGRGAAGASQHAPNHADAESYYAERLEHLGDPDFDLDDLDDDGDIQDRPVADVIADICRDLGLACQFGPRSLHRRGPSDIEALCARAAKASPA